MGDSIYRIQVRTLNKQVIISIFKGWKYNLLYLLVFHLIMQTMIRSKFIFILEQVSKQMISQEVMEETSYIVINNQGKELQLRSFRQTIDHLFCSLRFKLPPLFQISIILFQALPKNPINSRYQISTLSFVNEVQPQV